VLGRFIELLLFSVGLLCSWKMLAFSCRHCKNLVALQMVFCECWPICGEAPGVLRSCLQRSRSEVD
jgi:hypothetical protein